MQVVDIYCRTATDEPETPTKLERQEAVCRAYCQEHALTVGMVYQEVSSGIIYHERKQLSLMRTRYRDGNIQGVVVTTLDRLSRSQAHLVILMEEMEKYGVTLHCMNEQMDDTPLGRFARFIVDFITEIEREKMLEFPSVSSEQ